MGVTVTILVVRDPDAANDYTVSAPDGIEVKFVEADLGSGFDSYPHNDDEADYAIELADSLDTETQHLPEDDPVRVAAMELALQLRNDAEEVKALTA